MKKIIIDYHKGMDLNNLDCYGVIVSLKGYSLSPIKSFTLKESLLISDLIKQSNKKSFILMDKIITQLEVNKLIKDIKIIIDNFDYIIYSDMAFLSLVNNKEKLIYYPKTLINSTNEIRFYQNKKINVIISNELSIDEIKEIDKNVSYSIEAFGYHQMFYSKRKLISLYKDYYNANYVNNKKVYFLKEEKRDDLYSIVEKKDATLIYTDYCYFLFDELLELNNCDFIYLNSSFIKLETYLTIIKLYNNLLNGLDYKLELDEINKSKIKLSKGFLKQKSVLLKKGANDE